MEGNNGVSLLTGLGISPQVLKSYCSEQFKEQAGLLALSSESVRALTDYHSLGKI